MQIELTKKQYRRLLDLVYIGNWVLNSTRGTDRFSDYDEVEGLLFTKAPSVGMPELIDTWPGGACPSRAFVTGGIHGGLAGGQDLRQPFRGRRAHVDGVLRQTAQFPNDVPYDHQWPDQYCIRKW